MRICRTRTNSSLLCVSRSALLVSLLLILLSGSGSEPIAVESNASDIVTSADLDFVVHGVPDAKAATLTHACMASDSP